MAQQTEGISVSFEGNKGCHLFLIGVAGLQRKQELLDAVESIVMLKFIPGGALRPGISCWGSSGLTFPIMTTRLYGAVLCTMCCAATLLM